MDTLMIMIIWTWGITPTWVNVVGTVICGLRLLIRFINFIEERNER